MNDILQKLRDPSGGSDSHEVCDICGKNFSRECRRS